MEEKEVWERLTVCEQNIKSAHHRLDSVEKLTESVYEIATETKALREDFTKVNLRIETLEKKPAQRLDLIINTVITALCSGIAGYILSYFIK